ncbi:MAG: class I SAM-dependent RNA methyltransferase [Alphaproteobacteria bacterium]|nr:class I SAM-dependent RNA methyltransferase [Alphaproteobacteria bacterium]
MAGVEHGRAPAPAAETLCPHFGSCGGCAAQDKAPADYRAWKRGFAEAALRRAGLGAEIADLVGVPPASRRRARFFASRTDRGLVLGFRARGSHDVVDMTVCRVLEPALFALTGELRAFFEETLAPGQAAEAEAQVVGGALDLLIRAPAALDLPIREALTAFARDAGIARLSYQAERPAPAGRGRNPRARRRGAGGEAPRAPEVIVQFSPVTARFGDAAVALPPLAFLQASAAGEAALVAQVLEAVSGVPRGGRVADLYCGAGTFTFPLARQWRVVGYDGDEALIEALNAAARASGRGAAVTAEARNLARRPLWGPELAAFDAVVLDPPRAGARAQAEALAGSSVSTVVMVSCDPASFARDGKILADGGFAPGPVTLVDQFVWTRHLELVAAFCR